MSERRTVLPPLGGHWRDVVDRLRGSGHVALFFDFDGTLVPMARRPTEVRLSAATRRGLGTLARHSRVSVFVISGRRRHDLVRRVDVPGIRCLGLYGWEHAAGFPISRSTRAALVRARAKLAPEEALYPGLWLEDKGVSLSIHLRELEPAVRRAVRQRLGELSARLDPVLRAIDNRLDVELVPKAVAGKGAAVRRLLAMPRLAEALPVYFGDDLSDEPAFDAVRGGIAVLVGSGGPSRAHYAVPRRAALPAVIARLESALR